MTVDQLQADEIEPGRYTCPLCPARFESVGDKRRHLRKKHQ